MTARHSVRTSVRSTAALALVAGLAGAPGALAADGVGGGTPWKPYRTSEVVVPAERSTCGFDVRITPLVDEEEYRTTSTYPDGSPRTQTFRGTLIERYTNLATGTSVVEDLSATAVFTYTDDGAPLSLASVHGAFGTTMPPGSTPDTGLYVLSGHGSTVTFAPDGSRSFTLGPNGTAVDVCDVIG